MGTETVTYPVVTRLGFDGLLVRFSDMLTEPANRAALALRAAVDTAGWDAVLETSTALVSTFVKFDPMRVSHPMMEAQLAALLGSRDWYAAPLPSGRRRWHVPCAFGGEAAPQLTEAAALAGVSDEQAVAALTQMPLRAQTLGFAPGQPYLGQLPEAWDIPRQIELTSRVPVGAVVLAIRQICLFANATPTGWRHVGQTKFSVFRSDADNPFVLRPGDEVQFHAIAAAELEGLEYPLGGARSEELQ